MFAAEFPNCFFRTSGSGIPGVGVAPFGAVPVICFFNVFSSGIPGVGVAPFCKFALTDFGSGMPGVVFAEGGIGLAERPGGRFFGSIFVMIFVFFAEFDVFSLAGEHAKPVRKLTKIKTKTNLFDIK